MNEIIKKCVVECIKVMLSAILAGLGLTVTGCYTTGDNSSPCLVNIERVN